LLDELLGNDPGLGPVKQLLVEQGKPFFLEETVRTLVETKAPYGLPGQYRLTQPIQSRRRGGLEGGAIRVRVTGNRRLTGPVGASP